MELAYKFDPIPDSIPLTSRDIENLLTGALDSESPAMIRVLVDTWNAQAEAIKYGDVEAMLNRGSISQEMIDQWQQDYSNYVATTLNPALTAAAITGGTDVQASVYAAFGSVPAEAMLVSDVAVSNWIRSHGAELVVDITDSQRQALAGIVHEYGVKKFVGADELARYIRPVVGLTPGEARAVAKYRESLLTGGMSRARADALVGKYSSKLHRGRALRIARTEISFAFNHGMLDTARAYRDGGHLPRTHMLIKEWLTNVDERTCPYCNGLNGQVVGLEGDYVPSDTRPGRDGVDRTITLDAVETPPAHPNCRCTTAIVLRRIGR